MRIAGYFDQVIDWDRDLVRDYTPGDTASLLRHVGDLICNTDMLVVSAKGFSSPQRLQYDPPSARLQLFKARDALAEIAERINDAIAALAAECQHQQEHRVDDQQDELQIHRL